jgi:aspartate carbamoyltransferase catalytic subunit
MGSLGVEISHDFDETLVWADVVNMLRIQHERQGDSESIPFFPSIREYTLNYGLTQNRLDRLDKQLTVLHPGPINRGVEISSGIADSDHSLILDQVENGVATRMAVMYLLARR